MQKQPIQCDCHVHGLMDWKLIRMESGQDTGDAGYSLDDLGEWSLGKTGHWALADFWAGGAPSVSG